MNIKTFAKSRKLTLKQVNELCNVVLEETPADLTQDHISKLDAALAAAAEKVAALPPGEEEESEKPPENEAVLTTEEPEAEQELTAPQGNGMVVAAADEELTETAQVIEILGEDLLRRNVAIFLTHHIKSLQRLTQTHSDILHKFEQDIYAQTGETLARMTRNTEEAFNVVERIAKPQTTEDEQRYQEYLSLVSDFLSTPVTNPKQR
ncbi:MAG: hypothetical protein KME46_32660 [Brasilonema angustatum HA4187-MV1]|jgi:hypothetical protein|nr:hypothetical protein [Brasilonema angustatum HA4187-MV1]